MKKWQVRGSSAVFLLLLMAAAGCVAAPVYYLNDDVTMRGILSGACTGTPDGHAVYMKYPLTWLLAGLYRLSRAAGVFIPWFDLFLAGCILLTGAGILSGCLELSQEKTFRRRMGWALAGALVFVGLLLPQYLYMHYTVVAAILAGGALFLWGARKGRKLPIILLGLCYLVRSQVFFLALPFLLVAVLDDLTRDARRQPTEKTDAEERVQGRHCGGRYLHIRKQGGCLLTLAIVIAVLWGIDCAGYGSGEWRSYREYNDSRTKLYDYTDFLSTDRYRQCYEQLGLDWEQFQVLTHYDTVLDRSIDAQVLERTVEGINDLKESAAPADYLGQCVAAYYRHVRYDGRPYSLIWAGCYGTLLILLAAHRRWDRLLLLAALAMGRSLIWIYLIARGRFPERIWISLYLIEICLLLRMILGECPERGKTDSAPGESKRRRLSAAVMTLCLVLLGGVALGQMIQTFQRVSAQQEKQNQWNRLTEKLKDEEDCLYLADVFSVVAYAGELYEEDSDRILLLGGWLTGSPLVRQRLALYNAVDGGQALLHYRVRLVAAKGRDMTWLESYLEKRLGEAKLMEQETIACGDGAEFAVYRLIRPDGAHPDTY